MPRKSSLFVTPDTVSAEGGCHGLDCGVANFGLCTMSKKPPRLPGLSERLEILRLLNEEKSRSRRKYTTNIQHIVNALLGAGYASLDAQAKALGIHRATAWTIIGQKHKLDRLNTNTINRMLANPELPPRVRVVIEQYVAERPVLGRPRKMQTFEICKHKEQQIYEGDIRCKGSEKSAEPKRDKLQRSKKYAKL